MDKEFAAPVLKRILHPTDFSAESEFAYGHALRLAVAAGATLHVVHVDQRAHSVDWDRLPSARETLVRWGLLSDDDEAISRLLEDFEVKKIAAYGTEPVGPILEYLDEAPADLVVLATHQHEGLDRWLHREVAQKLVRRWPTTSIFLPYGTPGFVSPDTGVVSLRKVLIPMDWTPEPQSAVDAVEAVAEALDCPELELVAFYVGDDERSIPDYRPPQRPGWTWREELGEGPVVDAILHATHELDADLIAMATAGRDGFLDALRGSTTEQVLRQAECPLLSAPAYSTT